MLTSTKLWVTAHELAITDQGDYDKMRMKMLSYDLSAIEQIIKHVRHKSMRLQHSDAH